MASLPQPCPTWLIPSRSKYPACSMKTSSRYRVRSGSTPSMQRMQRRRRRLWTRPGLSLPGTHQHLARARDGRPSLADTTSSLLAHGSAAGVPTRRHPPGQPKALIGGCLLGVLPPLRPLRSTHEHQLVGPFSAVRITSGRPSPGPALPLVFPGRRGAKNSPFWAGQVNVDVCRRRGRKRHF